MPEKNLSLNKTAPASERIEVHNVWTILGGIPDGSRHEEPMCWMGRPQDWGNPRWHYDLVRFEAVIEGKTYVNHCHCWTDLRFDTPTEYFQLFSELIVSISLPGTPVQLCGRDYLAEDDFWNERLDGPLPPIWDMDGDNDGS